MTRAFAAGEQVLLIDTKKRRYLLTLTEGKEFPENSLILGSPAARTCCRNQSENRSGCTALPSGPVNTSSESR